MRTIRSFVIREGRFTHAQKKAFEDNWSDIGIDVDDTLNCNLSHYFMHSQPLIMDIGFGNGDSLVSLAQQRKDLNFIGVEVYRPGIGAALEKINTHELTNVRIINHDIQELIPRITKNIFAGMVVWFPDPWPKKRHHKRRLLQKSFLINVSHVIQSGGILHIASDWQPYVDFIQEQLSQVDTISLLKVSENPLNLKRPHTKFEQRGLGKGHKVTDLIYQID
ncbi:MAG: tRNA (guanosine(46)-N7)-methyltransferase TrmB [Pseudomonadota bacterium]